MGKYEPVTFEDSQGNTISNDPIWLAQQTLKAAGIGDEPETEAEAEAEVDEDIDKPADYKDLDAPALKALASERGVDLTGLKKVSEVRAAIVADDVRLAAEAEVEAANAQ